MNNVFGPLYPPTFPFSPTYGSFISQTTQPTGTTNPIPITYDLIETGTIAVVGSFPSSEIVIPATGTYRVFFSAQCDTTSGNHYLEIFPVVNGTSVPNSNTRIAIGNQTETCLAVEYLLPLNANDILELYMFGDSTNARLLAVPADNTKTPVLPLIPSIIVSVQRID